jgi:hypothetical protein
MKKYSEMKEFTPPDGWKEVFPKRHASWKVCDIKDRGGNLLPGSRKIVFYAGESHCLIKT